MLNDSTYQPQKCVLRDSLEYFFHTYEIRHMQNKCHFLLLNTISSSSLSEGGNKIVVVIGFLYHYIEIRERKAHKIDGR